MTIANRRRLEGAERWLQECERRIEPQISGCWLWLGSRHASGHGRLELRIAGIGQHWYAHRLVYELLLDVVPEELVLDHLCRNRWCVNPLEERLKGSVLGLSLYFNGEALELDGLPRSPDARRAL